RADPRQLRRAQADRQADARRHGGDRCHLGQQAQGPAHLRQGQETQSTEAEGEAV
ncbi:hypothetical protein LTR60_005147, partial [Cryomyces antarcticus]